MPFFEKYRISYKIDDKTEPVKLKNMTSIPPALPLLSNFQNITIKTLLQAK
jgi:hypothetical protein